jgi:hypothetical protein
MKTIFALPFVVLLIGCNTAVLPIQRIEYSGRPTDNTNEYAIRAINLNPRIYVIVSPETDTVLFNLYEPDGQLGITLYHGIGGSKSISFESYLSDYGYKLKKGMNNLILYGNNGRMNKPLIYPYLNK